MAVGTLSNNLRHGELRTERVELRLTPTDRKFLEDTARRERRSMNSYAEEWLDKMREAEKTK